VIDRLLAGRHRPPHRLLQDQAHSALRAVSGSVLLARRAGKMAATAAARPRTSTAAPMVVGSVGESPKRKRASSRDTPSVVAMPPAAPSATGVPNSIIRPAIIRARVAPRARRVPISFVRRATANDIVP